MIINKLNQEIFFDFMSEQLGLDAGLCKHDMDYKIGINGILIKIYLGGEMEDERKFLFRDENCLFKSGASYNQTQDLSYEWVQYLIEYAEELSPKEIETIVNKYNLNIENDIQNYASEKRKCLIS